MYSWLVTQWPPDSLLPSAACLPGHPSRITRAPSACLQRSGSGKTTSSPAENYHLARRRTLQVVVSSLLTECGFESAEKAAVESLTEMIQSCM